MGHIAGDDRDQMLLLPDAVDDYVDAGNPVRFIDAFVDGLDLGALGFARAMPKAGPTGLRSRRPVEALYLRLSQPHQVEPAAGGECHRNIELIWLLRRLTPDDFKTIADFRRDNRAAFKAVFREFVILCRDLDLFGRELLAVDGTRIKAVNNKDRNYTRRSLEGFIQQADARLDDYLKRLDESDVDDVDGQGPGGGSRSDNLDAKIAALREKRGRYLAILRDLERSGENQISLTDPDSRAMAGHTRVGVGYNAQIVVDVMHKLIVEQQVNNQVLDMGQLTSAAKPARQILDVETIEVVADRGYFKTEDIVACEEAGMIPYLPKPNRGPPRARRLLSQRRSKPYLPDQDVYLCPGGATLHPKHHGKLRDLARVDYANRAACMGCSLRPRCTTNFRRIPRVEGEDVLDRMAVRLKAKPAVLDQRRMSVEHPFGSIKQWMNQGAFLMRRLPNVQGEFSLTALAYNIRRAMTLLGVPKMMEAVGA